MRHRVTLLEPPTTRDAMKQRTGAPTIFATRWARLRAANGTELLAAAQTGARVSHVVEMRHLDGVSPTMTLEYDGRTFDVNAVLPDGKNREMTLHCTERPS